MKHYFEKYISTDDLTQKIKKKNIPSEYFSDYMDSFARIIEENDDFDGYSENEIIEEIDEWIEYCALKISDFIEELNRGHSKEFSKLIAFSAEVGIRKISDAYDEFKKEKPEQAINEIENYCKRIGCDDICTEYFLELLKEGYGYTAPGPLERAIEYSKIYNKAISNGKSIEYAKILAEQRVDLENSSEIYCECYAHYFVEAKNEGKSGFYTEMYAHKISEYFANQYSRFEEIKYDENDSLNTQRIKDEMDKLNL